MADHNHKIRTLSVVPCACHMFLIEMFPFCTKLNRLVEMVKG